MILLVAWQPSRVALQTALLVPSVLDAGPQLLDLAPAPTRLDLAYADAAGAEHPGLLWLPAGASADRPVALVVIVYGINSLGLEHPGLLRIADAAARVGIAIYVPDLPSMDAERLDPAEIGRIVAATQTAAAQGQVDPDRVGMIGISVGGSLALRAAADPAIADSLDWVAAFGAPADMDELVANVVAHAYERNGEVVDWEPTLLARQVIFEMLVEQVADERDRDGIRFRYQEEFETGHPSRIVCDCMALRSADARGLEALLTAGSLEATRAALEDGPAGIRNLTEALSPVRVADAIHARVYLMHDTGDHHVPVTQSEELAEALEKTGADVHFTEFRLFDHVTPETANLVGAAPEIWKLFWYLQAVLADTL